MTVETSTNQRDKILQRVMNLRARADNAGSSEAEMNTALTMAMKLMDSYNIEEAELAIAEAQGRIVLEIVQKVADSSLLKGAKKKHKVVNVLGTIAKFTETQVIVCEVTGEITFVGHRPDTELANFLTTVIRAALDREYETYQRRSAFVGYGAKNSFQTAMASRIATRLRDLIAERDRERAEASEAATLMIENDATASSTALVVSEIAEQKAREVTEHFNRSFRNTVKVRPSTRSSNGTAHGAGIAAGNRVNLGKAIAGTTAKQIA